MLIKSLNILLLIASALSFAHAEQTRSGAISSESKHLQHHTTDDFHPNDVTHLLTVSDTVDTDSSDAEHPCSAISFCLAAAYFATLPDTAQRLCANYSRPQGRAPPNFA